jgi:uncharacterized protein
MTVFVDTSALYALIDRRDACHLTASVVWERLLTSSALLVTSNYVLLETYTLLQTRMGLAAVRDFNDSVVPMLSVDWVAEERHRSGVEAVLTAQRRKLSLVDCVSFQTMRGRGISEAFTLDSHFREQGFSVIP